MTGFHLEPLLAGAYILLLMTIAFALEWMARHTHKRADQYHTGGFHFHPDKDIWECPTGMALMRTEVDYEQRVVRYRAPAHACNHCVIKSRCTHSDRGREIPVPMDPLLVSASLRFQTGFSLILFALCACIAVIELLRHGHGAEAWTMAVLVAAAVVLSKRVAGHLRSESGATGTSIRPEQIARAK
jgi:hypothetical protein